MTITQDLLPRTTTAVALLASALFIAPLWIVTIPAMMDGPSRFAELYLLQNLPGDKLLSRFYETDWTLIPALAGDVIVSALARLLPLASAIKVFLSLGVTNSASRFLQAIRDILAIRLEYMEPSPAPGSPLAYREEAELESMR